MKLYWKYTLPKQQFRPFDHFGWSALKEGEEVTDQHIIIRSEVDKAFNLGLLGWFINIIGVIFSFICVFLLFIDGLQGLINVWGVPLITVLLFSIGSLIYFYAQRTNIKKYNFFDRENGRVIYHMGWPRKKVFSMNWDDIEGRLAFNRGRYGRSEFNLILHDTSIKQGIFLSSDIHDPETVLRHWSFLVQYMDKTKPLPDTPNFKDYSNRTTGLWTEQAWAFESCRKGFDDPYDVWLKESMEKQKQDENETLRKSGRMVDTGRG